MDYQYLPKTTPFYLMAKPVGAACNLNCTYCYYLEKDKLYPDQNKTMTTQMLYQYIDNYVAAQTQPQVLFTWHGGEALLRGIPFYQKAVNYQLQIQRRKKIQIDNSLQTNGTQLTDEWCIFFKKNNFLIGISIDGPEHCHNKYRKSKQNKDTFNQVMRGIRLLQKHGVEFNILSVVNDYNVHYPLEVYRFFKEIGAHYIQFTPIVEQWIPQASSYELKLTSPNYSQGAVLTPWSVNALDYGKFMCAIFDEWVKNDVGNYFIINFDALLANWFGVAPSLCIYAETCGNALALEYNGDVYACDHYVFPEYKLGNIATDPLLQMVYSDRQVEFGKQKRDRLPDQCKSCSFLFTCHGECPKNRIIKTNAGQDGLNYLCEGLKMLYTHIAPYMEFMAEELRNERSPASVMSFQIKR